MSWNHEKRLLNCPFCGTKSEINHEYRYYGSYIRCANEECPIHEKPILFDTWQNMKNKHETSDLLLRVYDISTLY